MNLVEQLNHQFAIKNHVEFTQGKGNLPLISVSTPQATARISLHGGQVLSYQPVNAGHDLLFVSNNAFFQAGKAIKGGAPICWPWFAAHPDNDSLPFHGLVRNQPWQLESTEYRDNGDVQIILMFKDTEQTLQSWPYSFELKEVITIGENLAIELITTNTSTQTFPITQAIHTYFSVGDITQVQVTGLENKTYLDKVEQFTENTQAGPIHFNQEVDRIYQHIDKPVLIEDKAWRRRIHISHTGSTTCVVWNPWIDISRRSQDLQDDDYQHFVCVETANAAGDVIMILPGNSHTLSARYKIENT